MPQKRIDTILDIIKENGFVTVKYLCDELHYSKATINRDLNLLQSQGCIVRSYGGAELKSRVFAPLVLRCQQMKNVKSQLAKAASDLITDNITVFIGGSSTTQFLGKYLTKYKKLTVITNNLNLASHLSEAGVNVVSLGGKITERPYIVGGMDAAVQASSYNADIMFFSTYSVTSDGKILGTENYIPLLRSMQKNSTKIVYICDSNKLGLSGSRVLFDFSQVSAVVTDYRFDDTVKQQFPNTEFIEIDF